jgi:uncharacterized membrane protein YgcG
MSPLSVHMGAAAMGLGYGGPATPYLLAVGGAGPSPLPPMPSPLLPPAGAAPALAPQPSLFTLQPPAADPVSLAMLQQQQVTLAHHIGALQAVQHQLAAAALASAAAVGSTPSTATGGGGGGGGAPASSPPMMPQPWPAGPALPPSPFLHPSGMPPGWPGLVPPSPLAPPAFAHLASGGFAGGMPPGSPLHVSLLPFMPSPHMLAAAGPGMGAPIPALSLGGAATPGAGTPQAARDSPARPRTKPHRRSALGPERRVSSDSGKSGEGSSSSHGSSDGGSVPRGGEPDRVRSELRRRRVGSAGSRPGRASSASSSDSDDAQPRGRRAEGAAAAVQPQPPQAQPQPAAAAAAAVPQGGLHRFFDLSLALRLAVVGFLMGHSAPPERQPAMYGALVGFYLLRVGLVTALVQAVAGLLPCCRPARAQPPAAGAGGAVGGGGGGGGEAGGVAPRPAAPPRPRNAYTAALLWGRGNVVADVIVFLLSFAVSLAPQWVAEAELEPLPQPQPQLQAQPQPQAPPPPVPERRAGEDGPQGGGGAGRVAGEVAVAAAQ